MKIKTSFVCLAMLVFWQLLTGSLRDPNNPPTGRTGAPGEATCAASGCHNGGAFTGSVSISGVPDTVTPDATYAVTLTQTSNAVRGGFELTCLDGSNLKCGTLASATGVNVTTSGGRQYARQSTPKNLSSGSVSWTYNWKAPASASGDSATFYFVSLAANGNGKESGDNVLKASKTIFFPKSVSALEAPEASLVKIYPTTVQEALQIDLIQHFSGQLTVFDLQGKVAMRESLAQNNRIDMSSLGKGFYLAQVKFDGKVVTKKFMVQ